MRCAGILVVCALAIGCASGGAARRQGSPLRHTGSELIHESGLRTKDQSIRQPPPAVTPDPPAAARESPPEFSYDLYSDKQGHFSYDGAALALVKRPSHLQRVYADVARGEARSKSLVLELEYWFQQTGIAVADRTAALGCRVLPELQPSCRPPNWEFVEQFLGDSAEAVRLREVLAEAYARRARQLGIRNDVTIAGVNLLLAGSLAEAVLARVGVVEARTAGRESLASEAKAAKEVPASSAVGRKGAPMQNPTYQPVQNAPTTIGGRQYTGHALDQMHNRGLTPSVVEDTIARGTQSAGHDGATIFQTAQARVILNPDGSVKTVMPMSQ